MLNITMLVQIYLIAGSFNHQWCYHEKMENLADFWNSLNIHVLIHCPALPPKNESHFVTSAVALKPIGLHWVIMKLGCQFDPTPEYFDTQNWAHCHRFIEVQGFPGQNLRRVTQAGTPQRWDHFVKEPIWKLHSTRLWAKNVMTLYTKTHKLPLFQHKVFKMLLQQN